MGEVVEGVLQAGGEVIGVIFFFLCKVEVCYEGFSYLYVVDSMYECKIKMV